MNENPDVGSVILGLFFMVAMFFAVLTMGGCTVAVLRWAF